LRPLRRAKKSGNFDGVNQNTTQQHQGGPTGTATHSGSTTTAPQKWGHTKERIVECGLQMPANQLLPEWIDARRANHLFTICKSTLYRLADEGKIRTSSLRERGKLRGKRLFSTVSLQNFINSRASGGEES